MFVESTKKVFLEHFDLGETGFAADRNLGGTFCNSACETSDELLLELLDRMHTFVGPVNQHPKDIGIFVVKEDQAFLACFSIECLDLVEILCAFAQECFVDAESLTLLYVS